MNHYSDRDEEIERFNVFTDAECWVSKLVAQQRLDFHRVCHRLYLDSSSSSSSHTHLRLQTSQ